METQETFVSLNLWYKPCVAGGGCKQGFSLPLLLQLFPLLLCHSIITQTDIISTKTCMWKTERFLLKQSQLHPQVHPKDEGLTWKTKACVSHSLNHAITSKLFLC